MSAKKLCSNCGHPNRPNHRRSRDGTKQRCMGVTDGSVDFLGIDMPIWTGCDKNCEEFKP
jgi:hypothetical protein